MSTLVKELTVISTLWKNVELTATKRQFDNGAKTHAISPVITCTLPNDIEVFGGDKPVVFAINNRKMIKLEMHGYHIGNKEIVFGCFEVFDKEFPIKAFYL